MKPPGQLLGSFKQSSRVVTNFILALPCMLNTFRFASVAIPSTDASLAESNSGKLLFDEKLEKSRRCFSVNSQEVQERLFLYSSYSAFQ